MYGATEIQQIWERFGKDREKMQQLNQDMELHGQGYAVPPDLMPVFDTILQCVFSVTPRGGGIGPRPFGC